MPHTTTSERPVLSADTEAVLSLYRRIGAADVRAEDFLPVALVELQQRVPFDLACAATVDGAIGGLAGRRWCRWPAEGTDALLERALQAGGLHRQALESPGRALRHSDGAGVGVPTAHALVIVARAGDAGLTREIALWRRGFRQPFRESEAQWLDFIVPHVLLAGRMHLSALGRRRASLAPGEAGPWFAICDAQGAFLEAEEGFLAQLRAEHPRWPDARLPPTYRDVLDPTRAIDVVGEQLAIRRIDAGPVPILQLRRLVAADRLSTMQRLIAVQLAAGRNHREIAAAFAISAATVRNHTAAVYRRLDVSNRAQLLHAMRVTGRADWVESGTAAPITSPEPEIESPLAAGPIGLDGFRPAAAAR